SASQSPAFGYQPGSNSERSADSPLHASEDDSSGHVSPPDPSWTEERFRVDRKKLETMLLAASEGRVSGGEDFFQKVMDETSTQIAWPSKLKIGAKSKKDPHIKVSGRREDVREAKERILSVLDTKSNRVTLKMDVSHTEHSHVIGKGGNNIKRVMEETGCHIHFPDSNRNSQGEKSNQVSIAGQPAGVEAARAKIRELLPLALMFECGGLLEPLDCNSPIVQHISQSCNVSIACKPPSHLYGNTAVVRGNQSNAAAVKRGTALLLDHLAGSMAGSVLVSTQLDIAPQHHLALLGRNGANLKHITQRTGAHIHFPDHSTHSHAQGHARRSTVYIQGSVEAVCDARQQLMGCLPLVLMFDVKEEVEVETQCITTLMEQLDVFISIKPKPKQPSKSVIVKSVERNAENMYETRRLLVPVNGHCSSSSPLLSPVGLDILASAGLGLSTLVSLPGFSSVLMLQSVSQGSLSGLLLHTHSPTHVHSHTPSPPPGLAPIHKPVTTEQLKTHVRVCLELLVTYSCSSNKCSDTFVEVGMPRSPSHSANGRELKQMLASSGKRQTVELLQDTKNSHLHSECLLSDSEADAVADKRAPGSERAAERNRLAPHIQCRENICRAAVFVSAMLKKPVVTEVRTPTNTWSGLGFSKSMPAESIKQLRRASHATYKPAVRTTYEGPPLSCVGGGEVLSNGSSGESWRDRNGSAICGTHKLSVFTAVDQYLSSSNYMDCISSMAGSKGCSLSSSLKGTDLPELFSTLGLGKYTDVFQQQEIDLQTFVTLTDPDLKELGISTFGARRKMLLAISELNKSRRKLFEPTSIHSSFLEGGTSRRLSHQFHNDITSISGRW
uniref:SAM domain-containing protein n=1 Tax=Pygocentrus nattereri TaxID=42514 RepID=A0A3B4D8X2_PYGNA